MKKKQAKDPLAKLGLVAKSEGLDVDELNRFCEENGIRSASSSRGETSRFPQWRTPATAT